MTEIVTIYYTNIEGIPWNEVYSMIDIVSVKERMKILEMRQEKDRCLSLTGKLLLLYSLNEHLVIKKNRLPEIEYTYYGKPFWTNAKTCFNISHSDNMVVCAYGSNETIGIDIEAIKYFDIELFVSILTKKEYLQLTAGENVAEFIKIWTMKEAILKADGRGLFADINQIIIDNNTAYFDNIIWYIKSCTIDKQYQISIASKTKIEVCYKEIKFKEIASIYNSLQSTLGNRNRLH